MWAFTVKRLASMVLVLFAVSVITFFAYMKLPGGDPATRLAGKDASPELIENIRERWGFDESLHVQYLRMMDQTFLDRDLVSYSTQTNVFDEIIAGLPATLSLAIGAGILWFASGVVVATVSAMWPGRFPDLALGFGSLILLSIPAFWLAVVMRYYLGVKAGLFPSDGYVPLTESPTAWFSHLMLPWFVLAAHFTGFYGRVLRANLLETVGEEHVRMARAKGLAPKRVFIKHVLRNSLIPVVNLFTLDFAAIIGGGAILVEYVFGLNGIGEYAAISVANLDLPPIFAVTLFGAFFIVMFSAVADVANLWLNPRSRPT